MALADDLKQVAFNARGIAGTLGFRPHRVYLMLDYFDASGDETPFAGTEKVEIVEGNGQPPKVEREQGDAVGFGNAMENIYRIGPVTPKFPGGGTDLNDLVGALARGDVRHIFYEGPYAPPGEGIRLKIIDVNADKPLRYIIRAQSEGEALKGL